MTDPTRHDVRQVLHDAHAFYRSRVDKSWVPHHLNRRNLYPQMQPAGIGYAPSSWTGTIDWPRGMGYSDPWIEAAGLGRLRLRGGEAEPGNTGGVRPCTVGGSGSRVRLRRPGMTAVGPIKSSSSAPRPKSHRPPPCRAAEA